MAQAITLKVLTQEGLVFEDEAVSVIAPGEPGYLGILRSHAPLVTTLKPGRLTWRRVSGEWRTVSVGQGLLEIVHDQLTVLTDTVSAPAEQPAPQLA